MARPIRDPNRKPTSPGAILLLDVLPELQLSQTEFAKELGVSRVTISELLHGHRALTAFVAVRLEKRFGLNAQQLMAMQTAVDLWEAKQELAAAAGETLALELLVLSSPFSSPHASEVRSAYTTPAPVSSLRTSLKASPSNAEFTGGV